MTSAKIGGLQTLPLISKSQKSAYPPLPQMSDFAVIYSTPGLLLPRVTSSAMGLVACSHVLSFVPADPRMDRKLCTKETIAIGILYFVKYIGL